MFERNNHIFKWHLKRFFLLLWNSQTLWHSDRNVLMLLQKLSVARNYVTGACYSCALKFNPPRNVETHPRRHSKYIKSHYSPLDEKHQQTRILRRKCIFLVFVRAAGRQKKNGKSGSERRKHNRSRHSRNESKESPLEHNICAQQSKNRNDKNACDRKSDRREIFMSNETMLREKIKSFQRFE